MIRRAAVCLALLCVGNLGAALELSPPKAAKMTVERISPRDVFSVPLGRFTQDGMSQTYVEGRVIRRAWRLNGTDVTPLQIIAPMRQQLQDNGFDIHFECADAACGGFDFRFALEVLPGPNMYVNIRSYYHVTALRGPASDPQEAVTILASTAGPSAFIQVVHVDTDAGNTLDLVVDPPTLGKSTTAEQVLENGRTVLSDLLFATGTTDLGTGPFASLQAVADLMAERPDIRIALVGHTDTIGGLDANIALSRQRAQAVRARLISQYGVAAERMDAEGMGYLAPLASNLTAEGRKANRRVEAVLLSTQN